MVDIINNISHEVYLCDDCVQSVATAVAQLKTPSHSNINDIQCEFCGMTLSQFKKTKRVGCGRDYELFGLDKIIKTYHHSSQHVGKVPRSASKENNNENLARLRSDMVQAIKVENYELAAKLRDKINKLEN